MVVHLSLTHAQIELAAAILDNARRGHHVELDQTPAALKRWGKPKVMQIELSSVQKPPPLPAQNKSITQVLFTYTVVPF